MADMGNTELNYCYSCMARLESGQTLCPVCGNDNSVNHNPPNTLPEGTILAGKYLVGRVLGQGGFGITYIGVNLHLKMRAAIKEYFPITACVRSSNLAGVVPIASNVKKETFRSGLDEFQAEAERLAAIDSPNIVKVMDFFRENGTSYIVMDYLDGNSLSKEVSERGGRLPWQEIPELFGPLILEIDKLHKDHLLHRDIKPDNIKVVRDKDGNRRLVLLDFGSARNFASADKSGSYTAYVTAGYAPYEQYIRRGKQGPYTDIYSVCATMYAAISGQVPIEATARKSGEAELQDLAELGIDVPKGISRAIMHGLAVDSRDRPQSMRELYDELYAEEVPADAGEEPEEPPAEDPEPALYAEGKRLMSTGSRAGVEQALKLFGQISGYKDADSLAEVCRRKIVPEAPAPNSAKKSRVIILAVVLAAAAGILLFSKLPGRREPGPAETAAVMVPAGPGEPPAETAAGDPTKDAPEQTQAALAETQRVFDISETEAVLRETQAALDMRLTNAAAAETQAAEPTATVMPTEALADTVTPTTTATAAPSATASPVPAMTNTPNPTATPLSTNTPKPEVKAGDIITLGRYEQDGNPETDPEAIEWQVLAVEDGRALLISRYGLDTTPYHDDLKKVTWETCTLRAWLNGEFFESAFNSEEKERIREARIGNPDNAEFGTKGGNDTTDRIFLLSIDEAEQYFANDETRKCWSTAYARLNGASVYWDGNETVWWRLRSPGYESIRNADVGPSGNINRSGSAIIGSSYVVRPAFWLDLEIGTNTIVSTITPIPEPTETPVPKSGMEVSELKTGEIITLGYYEQDGDLTNGAEAIKWQVLVVEDDRALVISQYGLDAKPYNDENTGVTWETCTLRAWLNGEFYNSAFNEDEKRHIQEGRIINPDNAEYGTKGGNDTTDRIFLLNVPEAEQYFTDNKARFCWPTAYAKKKGAHVDEDRGGMASWWLRSSGYKENYAVHVYDGNANWYGGLVTVSYQLVRPAFWLDLTAGTDMIVSTATTTPIPTKTSEPTMAPKLGMEVSEVKVGEIIELGQYEQDGDLTNGAEAVMWQVLAVEDGRALVISKYGLDVKPYNEEFISVTWETSTLRTWLNGEFYNGTFNSDEKGRIRQVTVKNPDNEYIGTKGGNDTTDRIFLLSIEEAKQFFADNKARLCWPTTYAKNNGAYTDDDYGGMTWWWLRSPGYLDDCAARIYPTGEVYDQGWHVDNDNVVVRPAFWLDLTAGTNTSTETNMEPVLSNMQGITAISEPAVSVGDIITMGWYEQDSNTANGAEAIEWQVLAVEDDRALVISRYSLDAKPYNEEQTSVTWETSTLRSWLNGEFYDSVFRDTEKRWIREVVIKNPDNAATGMKGGNDTIDRIFLLSIDEANQYFKNDEARQSQPTTYAISRGAGVDKDSGSVWWWLRTPGSSPKNAAGVNNSGTVRDGGGNVNYSSGTARPAFWLDLAAETYIPAVTDREQAVTDSSETTEVSKPMRKTDAVKTGDIITMGQYEQDSNTANGAEAIEWQVLAVEDGRALVISKYALDRKPYNEKDESVTWETCSLREWLNGEFYNNAFTSKEKDRIRHETLRNPDNDTYGSKGGNDTTDRIFLLSIEEAIQYFADDEARKCLPTAKARKRGADAYALSGGMTWWWLRSPGGTGFGAAYVYDDGIIREDGMKANNREAVRPAFWLNLTAETETVAEIGTELEFTDTLDTAAAAEPVEETAAVKTGDIITLGHYEQDENTANGAEEIEWQVLAVEDGRALVISKYGLDAKRYNEELTSVTWETSTLRAWLNGEFFNSAFSEAEKGLIREVTLKNPDNEEMDSRGGNYTKDRIFLLSIDEAEQYFANDEARKCWPTNNAEKNGLIVDEDYENTTWWWLRTPGGKDTMAACVFYNGKLLTGGGDVDYIYGSARPAFWLDLTVETDTSTVTDTEPVTIGITESKPGLEASDVEKVEIITLGQYEQDGDLTNGAEAIEWQVLTVEEDRALVISKYGLDVKPYNEEYTDVTWETCTLRAWLNGEFYNSAFDEDEKRHIQEVRIKNPDNAEYGTNGGKDTTDRIFLLSVDEAEEYFGNDEKRKCWPTTYAKNNGVIVSENNPGMTWWWLRSPGYFDSFAVDVYIDGRVNGYGNDVDSRGRVVRPAFWLEL